MLGKFNVLKFEKKVVTNLNQKKEEYYDVIEAGKHKFAIRDFKLQDGHDDSLPYSAVLCDNGKPLCKCINDGWGGQTELSTTNVRDAAVLTSVKKTIGQFKFSYGDVVFDLTLDFIADLLAEGENYKLNRTIKGKCFINN